MSSFPTIQNPTSIDTKPIKKANRNTAEDGKPGSRAKYTKTLRQFVLKWNAIPHADYYSLESFFDSSQGTVFTWSNPLNSNIYNVIFGTDDITSSTVDSFDDTGKNCFAISITLQEV